MSDNARHDGPIFIVGAPRSGTTLLQYILRSHPRISLPTGESHFIIPLQRRLAEFGDLDELDNVRRIIAFMYQKSAPFLESDLHGIEFDAERLAQALHREGCNTLSRIISGLFEKNARGEGKVRWGDKTPYYVLHMPTILQMFPDAQIIHLIRDGRDVALSLFGRQRDFGVYNIYMAAKYWQQYVEVGREAGKALDPSVYMEIRYEDILRDQRAAMQRICAFLGEEFSEQLIEFQTSDIPGKTPLLQKPVQSDNAEKWRSKMSPAQIGTFESAAGETLAAAGYDLTTPARRLPLPVRAAYRAHNWLRRRMDAR